MEREVSRKFLTEEFPNGSSEMTDEQLQEYISTRKLPIVSSLTNEQILTLIRQLAELTMEMIEEFSVYTSSVVHITEEGETIIEEATEEE
tara:strand:- start:112 stop:381 length:270 start_codon:yes stop_codon:yes gene_type:complete